MKKAKLRGKPSSLQEFGIFPAEIGLIFLCFSGGWGRKHLSNCRFVTVIILEDLATSVDVNTFEPCSPHLWSCSKRKTLYESWVSHVLCWSFWGWLAQSLRVEPAEQIVFGNDVTRFPTCSKGISFIWCLARYVGSDFDSIFYTSISSSPIFKFQVILNGFLRFTTKVAGNSSKLQHQDTLTLSAGRHNL